MNVNQKGSPIRVIQFGEGGFLRGFADWMLQKLNDEGLFNGRVAVVQPIREGLCDLLTAQGNVYTHIIRGAEGIEATKIDVIAKCVKPYEDFEEYLGLAENPDARFIISNTTESGIEFRETDKATDAPPAAFPAKLTLLLKRRFDVGLGGFVFLPCELIDRNGDNLKKTVLQYARHWGIGEAFEAWIERENVFCNTLVDRINTGYPKEETFDLGYEDQMINTSEYFHLWVIETEYDLERELPFSRAGLNVIVTRDALERYRTRKVRILNGAHTSMVPYALLSGFDTVKSCMDDEEMRSFIRACLFEEIIPTLDLPREELEEYAENVLVRFSNPYIKHYLSAISLNSVSKFRVRVLPSILEYCRRFGKTPPHLMFSFGKLIDFYKNGTPNDDPEVTELMKRSSVEEILGNVKLWGEDLGHLAGEVEKYADPSVR
ncbi:MAG: tagaturonate reductase [Ruminococcaceae bacterium]|nr:tagaturonate reductase [Oscillospiraceae bacterium]